MLTNLYFIRFYSSQSQNATTSPLRHSAAPTHRRSDALPLRRSANPPLRRTAAPPLRRSAAPPLRHSCSNQMLCRQSVRIFVKKDPIHSNYRDKTKTITHTHHHLLISKPIPSQLTLCNYKRIYNTLCTYNNEEAELFRFWSIPLTKNIMIQCIFVNKAVIKQTRIKELQKYDGNIFFN